jgi:two-component system NtrC family response regulator
MEAADFEAQSGYVAEPKQLTGSPLGRMTLDEMEKQSILQALDQFGGNLSHVAAALGISRAALYRRLEKYGITSGK